MGAYAIKTRKPGDKRWMFVSDGGSMYYLRIRAVTWKLREKADATRDQLEKDNQGYEFKVVTY